MTAALPTPGVVGRNTPGRPARRPTRVRLLFLSPHYGSQGGVRLVIDAVAAAARAAGHEVTAVTDVDAPSSALHACPVRLYPFPERARDWRRLRRFVRKFPAGVVRLVRAVRRLDPDVVSVHCARTFAPYAAALRGLTRVPQVVTLHEGALPPGKPAHERLVRLLVRSADVVTAVSHEGAAYAARVGGRPDARVLTNGYDPSEFRAAAPYRHARPYVLGVGRLETQKGFDVLIDALAQLAGDRVDLLLAGEGSERGRLEVRAAVCGVAERVHLLGETDRARTIALLRGAAVVACPSRWEGLPLVCIEALAAGRPVVATAVNGIPEIVRDGETGTLVAPDDAAALAASIQQVLHAPEAAAAIAERGRAMVEADRPWSKVTGEWLDVLTEAARA